MVHRSVRPMIEMSQEDARFFLTYGRCLRISLYILKTQVQRLQGIRACSGEVWMTHQDFATTVISQQLEHVKVRNRKGHQIRKHYSIHAQAEWKSREERLNNHWIYHNDASRLKTPTLTFGESNKHCCLFVGQSDCHKESWRENILRAVDRQEAWCAAYQDFWFWSLCTYPGTVRQA